MICHSAWSIGRDRDFVHRVQDECLDGVVLHDLRSDLDANRSWLSVSGQPELLIEAMMRVCELAFDRIDLNRHGGWHPRIGALDQCDFIDADVKDAWSFGLMVAGTFDIPVFTIDDSEEWEGLRDMGFGGLAELELDPTWGPTIAHRSLGVVGIAVRPFFLTIAATFLEDFAHFCQSRVRDIDQRRTDGEEEFAGVNAVAYPMPSYGESRMIIEFANPDEAAPDPVLEWLDRKSKVAGVPLKGFEIIGALRHEDLLETRNVPYRPEQVVDMFGSNLARWHDQ